MNLNTVEVNSDTVRRETFKGREYLVADVTAAKAMELNGGYVPAQSWIQSVPEWNGTPLPIGHPTNTRGEYISANIPEVVENTVVGQFYNVTYAQNKDSLDGELWVDVNRARQLGPYGERVVEMLEQGEPLEVSTAYRAEDGEPGVYNGDFRNSVKVNLRPDHLAVLPDDLGPGKCSVADGCGTGTTGLKAVNTDESPQAVYSGYCVNGDDGLEAEKVYLNMNNNDDEEAEVTEDSEEAEEAEKSEEAEEADESTEANDAAQSEEVDELDEQSSESEQHPDEVNEDPQSLFQKFLDSIGMSPSDVESNVGDTSETESPDDEPCTCNDSLDDAESVETGCECAEMNDASDDEGSEDRSEVADESSTNSTDQTMSEYDLEVISNATGLPVEQLKEMSEEQLANLDALAANEDKDESDEEPETESEEEEAEEEVSDADDSEESVRDAVDRDLPDAKGTAGETEDEGVADDEVAANADELADRVAESVTEQVNANVEAKVNQILDDRGITEIAANHKEEKQQERDMKVNTILSNTDKYSEEQLRGMDDSTLKTTADLVSTNTAGADFGARPVQQATTGNSSSDGPATTGTMKDYQEQSSN